MELEIFKQAKSIKENLDNLERQKYKLESSLKSCGLEVTIKFYHPGGFIREDEVSFRNKEIIKEMIIKELLKVTEEIELIKKEFDKL